jgi:hypothetical protein
MLFDPEDPTSCTRGSRFRASGRSGSPASQLRASVSQGRSESRKKNPAGPRRASQAADARTLIPGWPAAGLPRCTWKAAASSNHGLRTLVVPAGSSGGCDTHASECDWRAPSHRVGDLGNPIDVRDEVL